MKVRVRNMTSRTGRKVANQFEIYTSDGFYFQSYSAIIAFMDSQGNVTLDKDWWDYSATTGRYRNQFLGEGKAETEKKIKNGTYKLAEIHGISI